MQLSDLSFNQVVLIIIVIFLLFQLRQRKFHFWRSMLVPGLMLVVTFLFVRMELQGPLFNTIVLFGGGIFGLLVGMIIARLTKLKMGKDGSLLMRGSFIAMSIWFLIIVAKLYGQDTLNQWGLSSSLILSLFLMISVSTMISERIFIYYRYLRNRKKWRQKKR
ncbi:MAG: hypothetical protein ABFC12_01485 [Methanobacterium sp.]